jgi:hypothetical protein
MSYKSYPFEHTKKPLLDLKTFRQRQFMFFMYAVILIIISLIIGMFGYRYIGSMDWVSAFYNAALILAGMGPANELTSNAAKIFGGVYSLFSGVIFLSTVAVMFAPLVHRFLHRIHLEGKG